MNSRGNGTPAGPSFTAAADRRRSGRLKCAGLAYVVFCVDRRHVPRWAVLRCLTPPYMQSTASLWTETKHLAAASSIAE